jgi:galactitol-specific phosphotransferase system IIC component
MRFQRTLIGDRELLALLRPLWCFVAVSFGQGVGPLSAWAVPAPTITTLSVTSGGNAVATVASGSVVTLTTTVMAAGFLPSCNQCLREEWPSFQEHHSSQASAIDH